MPRFTVSSVWSSAYALYTHAKFARDIINSGWIQLLPLTGRGPIDKMALSNYGGL